ncbi:uncharacterized protein LY79DRAFT_104569 [Colletotrichum navitas]|uniref:Uncharacterized protein n=1 Tax=Colletotrichum navitas TaxID=681940 RepID=A0AAD8UYM5_9PEZI|nr:uncharacterized protein LY79DRAFT_104569 [Colletotrichum navitas]KAK1566195.1 hypothetical protein LY79DRAFT_104569 [Colletotrichum navitas]
MNRQRRTEKTTEQKTYRWKERQTDRETVPPRRLASPHNRRIASRRIASHLFYCNRNPRPFQSITHEAAQQPVLGLATRTNRLSTSRPVLSLSLTSFSSSSLELQTKNHPSLEYISCPPFASPHVRPTILLFLSLSRPTDNKQCLSLTSLFLLLPPSRLASPRPSLNLARRSSHKTLPHPALHHQSHCTGT